MAAKNHPETPSRKPRLNEQVLVYEGETEHLATVLAVNDGAKRLEDGEVKSCPGAIVDVVLADRLESGAVAHRQLTRVPYNTAATVVCKQGVKTGTPDGSGRTIRPIAMRWCFIADAEQPKAKK